MKIKSISATRIFFWYAEGFRLFRKQWVVWIGILLLCIALLILPIPATLIAFKLLNPGAGVEYFELGKLLSIVVSLVLPYLLLGGLFLGCADLDRGDGLRISHAFAGFHQHKNALLKLGLLVLLLSSLGFMISNSWMFINPSRFENGFLSRYGASMLFFIPQLLTPVFISAIVMASWLATTLVVLENKAAWEALKTGFSALFKNIAAFFLYGLVSFLLVLSVLMPIAYVSVSLDKLNSSNFALLGWVANLIACLGLGPTLIASIYVAYRDIFETCQD